MDNFGAWLLREIERQELTQTALAKMSKLGQGTISNIISGRRGRSAESLAAIAEALKLPREDVFREAGILPRQKETEQNAWVRRVEHKLEQITDERDQEIIEKTIDVLVPDKKARARRRAPNEGSS